MNIAFDLTSQLSFLEVYKWLDFVRKRCHEQVPVLLVGNKSEEAERWVDSMKVKDLESKESLFYLEASARSRENIDEIFSVLVDLMIGQENLQESTPDPANTVEPVLSGRPRGMATCPLNTGCTKYRSEV